MKRLAVLGLLTLLGNSSWAYDWPAPDVQVTKTFGQKVGGSVMPGIEVQTLSPVLTAPESGDVLFVFRPQSQSVQNLPSGLGGFVAVAHDNNLRSVTSRLTPTVDKKKVIRGEPLGQTEVQTGQSSSRHRIYLFDQQLSEIVNPLLMFPALTDAKAPVIYDVTAAPESKGDAVSLFGKSSLAVGYWKVHVLVSDPVTFLPASGKEKGESGQRGVYSVEAYLNGSEVFNTRIDSFQEKGGRWQLKGMTAYLDDVLVQDQEWNLGQVFFNQGTNILEIIVKDFQGNQAGKTFRILGTR